MIVMSNKLGRPDVEKLIKNYLKVFLGSSSINTGTVLISRSEPFTTTILSSC
jgi:hypothetical protein